MVVEYKVGLNKIPKDFFVTSGKGESDIAIHAGSYHLALRKAGIEMCNIITYSSILPAIANRVDDPPYLTHGSVLECIMACSTGGQDVRASVGIIYGWLWDRETNKKFGGLVCEYSGHEELNEVEQSLKLSLEELYHNGYVDKYEMRDITLLKDSFIPVKKYGTILISLCFTSFIYPIVMS
jgi:arginine decarboxylase